MRKETMKDYGGFTLIELMVVVVIIGVLATIGMGFFRSIMVTGRVQAALPYMFEISAKLRQYRIEYGNLLAADLGSIDEPEITDYLGVNVAEIGDFCFVIRTSGFAQNSEPSDPTPQFEVWAILRESSGSSVTGSAGGNSASCTVADGKETPSGWVLESSSGLPGREGTMAVLRYPAPPDGYRSGDGGQNWLNGVSVRQAITES